MSGVSAKALPSAGRFRSFSLYLFRSLSHTKIRRTLSGRMKNENLDIRQWMTWLGGLLAVWLLVVLPARSEASARLSDKQTYISWDVSQGNAATADPYCLPEVRSNTPVALVSYRPGFSFMSSPVFLQRWLDDFCHTLRVALLDEPHRSYYSFCFLRLVFEHQITINAP